MYTVTGSGNDLNAPPDQLHFAYQPLVGDGTIVAQLTTVQNIFQYTRAGIMIRASADPSSAYVFLNVQPNNGGCSVGIRGTAGVLATYAACSSSLPLSTNPQYSGFPAGWLQITRQGNTFSIQISSDGVTWTSASAPITVPLPANVLAGLAVVSDGDSSWATFTNVRVTPASAVASPALSPASGAYPSGQAVAISTATPGALIRYTLDGSAPSETAGTLYSGPIMIISATTVNAIAYAGGMADSAVVSAAYAISCISNLAGRGNASGPGGAQVNINWSAQTNATSYNVLRSSTNGGPYTLIGNTSLTGYRDGDDGLLRNTTYYYVVQPLEGSTEICQSNQAAIAIP